MENAVYFTYTCPVSRKTYAGHPRNGHLYAHDNDLEEAVGIIYKLARKHHQPVTWVINDQEYTDQEGLLHYFKQFQAEGDTILVTMELTTSPAGVDKYDTRSVISWIAEQCEKNGLRIDGLWSLKFLETDLAAIREMDEEKFAWTRNLAGSCWHQIGIDDSTWGGCPYNPYYPSVQNIRAPASEHEAQDFLMLEWLSRDIPAIVAGGFPATFSLDPADTNRKDAGGFGNEQDALKYSQDLIRELARQQELNQTVVIDVNEEARHFQTEGHDKVMMLDGMFGCASEIDGVKRMGYRELFSEFRQREKITPERLFVCKSVDWRAPEDLALMYEDTDRQWSFLRSRGNLAVEIFDYTLKHPGNDSNECYPQTELTGVQIVSQDVRQTADGVEITVNAQSERPIDDVGIVIWDAEVKSTSSVLTKSDNVIAARAGLDRCVFIRAKLAAGTNPIAIRLG